MTNEEWFLGKNKSRPERRGNMENKMTHVKKLMTKLFIIILLSLMIIMPNTVKAGYYDGITVGPALSAGNTSNNHLRTFIVPASSYSRKYAIRLMTSVSGTSSKALTMIINSKAKKIYTLAAFNANGSTPGTGVVGIGGTVMAATSGYNQNIGTYSNGKHLFTTTYKEKNLSWMNNGSGSLSIATYWKNVTNHGQYGLNHDYVDNGFIESYNWASIAWSKRSYMPWAGGCKDRVALVFYFDEEAPKITFTNYDNATDTLTVTAVDQTTDPVPAAGVKSYAWGSTTTTLDSPVASTTQTKKITAAGTVTFKATDAYTNSASASKTFYKVVFDYNYDGKADFVDYKMHGQSIPYPDIPSRDGFDFLGWSKDASATSGTKSGNITANESATYYALWKINNSLASATITLNPTTFVYTGSQLKPTETVVHAGKTLVNGTDYIVSYSNNVNVGTASLTVTAKEGGKYIGSQTVNYTITPRSITEGTLTISPTTYTYNGNQCKPTTTLIVNGKTLVSGTDYEITYSNNIDAGTATVLVTGVGNYMDSLTEKFTINKKSLAVNWNEQDTFVYNGSAQNPTGSVTTGVTGETIELKYSGSGVNVGNYIVTASIKSVTGGRAKSTNYTLTNTTKDFKIIEDSISDGSLSLYPTEYIYNGGENKPTPTLTVDGRTLTLDTDYTVEYSNHIDAGTATATLTGKGNYEGTISKTFTIKPKEIETIWSNTSLVYNKNPQKPTAIANTDVTNETVTLEVSGEQTNAGTYTATATIVSVSGGRERIENYKLIEKTTEFTIAKADRNLQAPDVSVEYDGGPHQIVATQDGDLEIQYSSNNSLTDIGSVIVTVWVEESENWLYAETTAVLEVTEQTVPVIWGETSLPYIGKPQKPTATATAKGDAGIDIEVELTISGEQTDVGGPYIATAIPTNANYILEPNKILFYIVPNPDVDFIGELDQTIFPYDELEKKPNETIWTTGVEELEGIELVKGKDYEVSYIDNIEPTDNAIVRITGINNYEGETLDLYFTIEKLERTSVVKMADYYFAATLPTPYVTDSDEIGDVQYYYNTIDSNVDGISWDTVVDSESLPVGTYYMYAMIAGTKHYKEKLTETTMFKVLPGAPLDPVIENKTYNGMEQIGVYGGKGITLSGITAATDVGTYIAYGTLAENYEWPDGGSETREFVWKIYPCNINNTIITLDPTEFMYDGTAHEPKVTVEFIVGENTVTLVEGRDYTVSYRKNINVGRAEAVITGIGNFSGITIAYFTITPIVLDRVVLDSYLQYYTGYAIEPKTIVYGKDGKVLVENRDYIAEYYDNIEIGVGTVKVIGINNYTGELETTFTIQGKNITNAKLLGLPYIYDGSEKCPDAEVKYNEDILIEGKDYIITYENNVNAGDGTAIAIITGSGEYAGRIRIPFSIMKADREAYILPGKAILLGTQGEIPYYYKGDDASTIFKIDDTTVISATEKDYIHEGTIDVTGLKVGKSTLSLKVEETQNYRELVLKSEVTVWETIEDAYPIYGSVIINDDDEYTNSPRTMLTLNVDFGDYMYISEVKETPALDNPDWHEFSQKMPYEFDSVEGEKTIYVWFKDKRGNISQMATDSIVLEYDASVPAKINNIMAHDNVLLDQTQIDRTAPDIDFDKYHNKTLDIEVISKQEDVMINGVRSGVDHGTIQYGYREAGEGMPNDTYEWQDTPVIEGLEYDKDYAFVTQAFDRAGNGITLSDETIIHTERKYETDVTLNDTNCQYNGLIQEIEEATFTLANDTPITGTITYTYYVDEARTTKTDPTRDGSLTEGSAPSAPGVYYVTVELKGDIVYYDVPEEGEEPPTAELRIGWDISKTTDDDVFAYPERNDIDSDEFILNVIGNGEMTDLDNLLATDKPENEVYWTDYKDKIVDLDIINDSENEIENIGAEIFNHLEKIEEIIIPDTIVKIGDYAFDGCTGVEEPITIPTSVIEIGANPFKDVNTPAFETEFAHRVFDTIDGVLVDIEHEKLISYPNGKEDEKYSIPETIKSIEESAFSGADNIKDVVIPNGVETIETRAFYDCPNLEIVEIEDLMDKSDNVIDLKDIGNEAFTNIKPDSIVYTFSEYVAEKFEEDVTHLDEETEIYYPPVFTLHPIDMNGAVGRKVKFIIDTKPGYPEETNYQWFRVKDGTASIIDGATGKEYTTDSLTLDNDQDKYYCRAYNDQYYYDRGYVNSEEGLLTMLDNANYIVERGSYNSYLFERLQHAFDFAINDDVIKPLQNVANEEKAILDESKLIVFDLENYTVALDDSIEIKAGSKIELKGTATGAITKVGEYIFENDGELVLNGSFSLSNTTGFGIKTMDDSDLVITSGNIFVDRNAIYAENADVTLNGSTVNITAITSENTATAVSIQKNTKFNMTDGNIAISYNTEPASGNIYGIYFDGEATALAIISGGTIKAESTNKLADAIVNAGKSDIIVSGNTIVTGSRAGIVLLDSNLYGDVTVESGTITGGEYGILNQAESAKVILGQSKNGVSITNPIVVGEILAIFNTRLKDTLEFYDGILYSHGTNIVYEDLDNTTLTLATGRNELIDTAEGREAIITEIGYSIFTENSYVYNGSTYKAAYLKENRYPTLTGPENQIIEVGEQGVFEVIAEGGHPDVYDFQWQVSTDSGRTWTSVTVGTGGTTNRYTTPIATETMNGYMYRCIVTNAKGDVISKEVTLVVLSGGDVLNQRPVGRIIFANGRIIEMDGDKKVVNMKLIVKSAAELDSLKLNGEEIFNPENLPADEKIVVTKDPNSPIEITKDTVDIIDAGIDIDGVAVVEYTYTYNLKVYANGIITVDMKDVKDRDNTITQTVDLFHDLKVEYYLSKLTETNNYLTITFYANKPVKPIGSIVNSYQNGKYLDLVSLDGSEYSYRFNLELTEALPETVFYFEDEAKNQTFVEVPEIVRVRYKQVKFNEDVNMIDDLTILDAYSMAQELEDITEVNRYDEIQNRYGLNSVQTDIFMSRARDIGAVDILNNATTAKSYDGIFTEDVKPTVPTKDVAYDYVISSENSFVAAAAKTSSEEVFVNENAKYVDIISKAAELYKGMNLSSFRIDETAPYMYTNIYGPTNITATAIARAAFRATIIGK